MDDICKTKLYNILMQAKIINKTTLTKKEVVASNFLNNRFLIIMYTVLLALFLIIQIFSLVNGITSTTFQTILTWVIIVVCFYIIISPFIRGLRWERRSKKECGKTAQDFEYQFFDIYAKIVNLTTGEESKIEYRNIRKRTETKKYISLNLYDDSYMVIDKNGFAKDGDYAKLDAYLKRFKL